MRAARQGVSLCFVTWWAKVAAEATKTPKALVWVRLLHMAWKAGSLRFPLPNGKLEDDGVTRFTKYRALRKLEAAGLIVVKQRHGRPHSVDCI